MIEASTCIRHLETAVQELQVARALAPHHLLHEIAGCWDAVDCVARALRLELDTALEWDKHEPSGGGLRTRREGPPPNGRAELRP